MTTAGYLVEGMTCGSCAAKVFEKVRSLSGVTSVVMDLVEGGRSPLIVTSGTKLGPDAVRVAVENVGFGLLPPSGRQARQTGSGHATQDSETRPDRQRMVTSIGGMR